MGSFNGYFNLKRSFNRVLLMVKVKKYSTDILSRNGQENQGVCIRIIFAVETELENIPSYNQALLCLFVYYWNLNVIFALNK